MFIYYGKTQEKVIDMTLIQIVMKAVERELGDDSIKDKAALCSAINKMRG